MTERYSSGRVLASATADRLPIIPSWARTRADFWSTVRRIALNQAHRMAYRALRLPLYAARTTLRAPRGAWVATTWCTGKVFDQESAPLRYDAARRADADVYLKLIRARNDRVRLRLLVLVEAALLVMILSLLLFMAAPDRTPWIVLVSVVALLGWLGSTPDKPLLDRAVIVAAAPKLTSDVVVEALGSLGIAGINAAIAKGKNAVTFPAPITATDPGTSPSSTYPSVSPSETSPAAESGSPAAHADPSA